MAARKRFLRDGVAPTTIASIADDIGVSVDTIYKSFGGKPGLVKAIADDSLAGTGPVPAPDRSDSLQASERDARTLFEGFGRLITEVAPRSAPIMLMVREAAAVDPSMAAVWKDLERDRLRRMMHNARNVAAAGHLRPGITAKDAGEVFWAYTSPELYERLVLHRRWSIERYAAFITDAMIAALLPAPPA